MESASTVGESYLNNNSEIILVFIFINIPIYNRKIYILGEGSTTNLLKHLKKNHPIKFNDKNSGTLDGFVQDEGILVSILIFFI